MRIYFTASFVAQHVWPSSLKFRKITSPFPHYYIINYRLSQVSANPATYNITWRHNGKRLPEDVGAGIIIGNQTLVLQKVYLLVISIVNRHHHRQSSSQSSIVITIVNSHHHRQLSSPSSIVITIINRHHHRQFPSVITIISDQPFVLHNIDVIIELEYPPFVVVVVSTIL